MKGLITESSPLTFPDNASLAEENFFLNRDGTRQRRLGMDFEKNWSPFTSTSGLTIGSVLNTETFTWKSASNNRNFDISVVKIGNKLYFFDGNSTSVSGKPLNGGEPIVLDDEDLSDNFESIGKWDFASIHGYLVVVTGSQNVYIISFDVNNWELVDSIKETVHRITIRDLFGIEEEGVPVDFRPPGLSILHHYNLRNQGWVPELQCAWKGQPSDGLVDSVYWTFDNLYPLTEGTPDDHAIHFPSNADMVWANKVIESADPLAVNAYDPFELLKSTYNKQEAPKGRYIIDLFNRGESRVTESTPEDVDWSDVEGVPWTQASERTVGGITSVASYMGRAVFAVNEVRVENEDDKTPSVGSMLFISQAKTEKEALVKCHAQLDPTAGLDFANLATDGGFVPISGLGFINSIVPQGNSLFIFSDRGVWQMNGGDKLFTMSQMNINRVSNVGSLCKNSVVEAEGNLLYISDGGIYALAGKGKSANQADSVNITQDTIQTLYDGVTQMGKRNSNSYYDRFTRQVKWLFGSEKALAVNRFFFDTEVIYDLNLKAFSINTIKSYGPVRANNPFVIGYLERPGLVMDDVSTPVTANGKEVTAALAVVVTTTRETSDLTPSSNKYWCIYDDGRKEVFTVSEYLNQSYLDWQQIGDGVDAEAFMITGHATAGDSAVFKRIPYITTHMKYTDEFLVDAEGGFDALNPSSCNLQVQWDWTDSPKSGKWSNPQEIYRLPRTFNPANIEDNEYGHTVITTKNRLRGKGKAFSLMFSSSPRKDCQLYGWSLELDAEVSV